MKEAEERIWQRVLEQPEQDSFAPELYRMARHSTRALQDYRAVSRGRGGQPFRMLEDWERANLESLCGLFWLCTGRKLRPETPGLREGRPDAASLYSGALEQLRRYTACSARPRVGVAFGELARRQTMICDALIRYLGAQGDGLQR